MNYQISIQDFEGPLDLLLHLVKEMKMDIYEINTGLIIEEYLRYIHGLQDLNIDIASEFLVMAAELVHLKSKMLIGKSHDDEKEESEFEIQSEEDLQNRLIEYQTYQEVTKVLKKLENKRNEIFTKAPESLKEYVQEPVLVNDGITVDHLLQAFLSLQERIHFKEPLHTKIMKREISVESRRKRIFHVLEVKKKVEFHELFEIFTREYIVVTFLALLDMSKKHEVFIKQESNFATIWIERAGEVS
ncbi:MAG: segregation/condensation protein A [Bacilli bacterium]|nr:segregation/condensation protein A [Bacilli bacterium]